jgi:hypothetical protein
VIDTSKPSFRFEHHTMHAFSFWSIIFIVYYWTFFVDAHWITGT